MLTVAEKKVYLLTRLSNVVIQVLFVKVEFCINLQIKFLMNSKLLLTCMIYNM